MKAVAPFTGAWIEIEAPLGSPFTLTQSHPSRVRGLKLLIGFLDRIFSIVAPFTGAWIEILRKEVAAVDEKHVAPFTGAWIEIWKMRLMMDSSFSRTLHGCVD